MIDGEVEEVWLCFPHCVLHHHRQEDWHCLYLQLRNEYTVTSPRVYCYTTLLAQFPEHLVVPVLPCGTHLCHLLISFSFN